MAFSGRVFRFCNFRICLGAHAFYKAPARAVKTDWYSSALTATHTSAPGLPAVFHHNRERHFNILIPTVHQSLSSGIRVYRSSCQCDSVRFSGKMFRLTLCVPSSPKKNKTLSASSNLICAFSLNHEVNKNKANNRKRQISLANASLLTFIIFLTNYILQYLLKIANV